MSIHLCVCADAHVYALVYTHVYMHMPIRLNMALSRTATGFATHSLCAWSLYMYPERARVQARFFACSVGDGDATTLLFVGGRLVLFTSAMHAAGLEQGTEASRSSIPARRLDRKDEAGKPLESSWTSAVHTARRRRSATTARIGTREAGMGLTLDSRPSDCGISHDAPDFFRSNIPIPERGHLIGGLQVNLWCSCACAIPGFGNCHFGNATEWSMLCVRPTISSCVPCNACPCGHPLVHAKRMCPCHTSVWQPRLRESLMAREIPPRAASAFATLLLSCVALVLLHRAPAVPRILHPARPPARPAN